MFDMVNASDAVIKIFGIADCSRRTNCGSTVTRRSSTQQKARCYKRHKTNKLN